MFTTVAYSGSFNSGGVLTYNPALSDPHVRVEGNNIIVPDELPFLAGVHAFGSYITEARIESPALRRALLFDAAFVSPGTTPLTMLPFNDMFYNPVPLEAFEPMRAMTAGAETDVDRQGVVVWLSDGPQVPVGGEIYTTIAVLSGVVTAWQWSNMAITLDQTLASGRYALVGAFIRLAGVIAARFVFVGGTWRPGVLTTNEAESPPNPIFRRGALGVYGEFSHDQPPTVDVLCADEPTEGYAYLDLIKLS